MPVVELNHYNIRAPRDVYERVRRFYIDVVGLIEGWRPGFTTQGCWLYASDSPVLHLTAEDHTPASLDTGYLDHVALRCTGLEAYTARLGEQAVEFVSARVPDLDMTQLFVHDPAGIRVELNFVGESLGE